MELSGQHNAAAALCLGRNPSTCCTEGWVDPGAGLDNLEKWKIPSSAKIQTTDCPACILVTTGTPLSNITVISNLYNS